MTSAEAFSNEHDGDSCLFKPFAQQFQELECPPLYDIVSGLHPSVAADSSIPLKDASLSLEDQEALFKSLQGILESLDPSSTKNEEFSVEPLRSFERVETRFGEVNDILQKLSKCKSLYMEQAAEVLANGSRNRMSNCN